MNDGACDKQLTCVYCSKAADQIVTHQCQLWLHTTDITQESHESVQQHMAWCPLQKTSIEREP